MTIFAGSDHAGFKLRQALVAHLRQRGHDVVDLGPETDARTDYPDHAAAVGRRVRDQPGSFGLLVCGSGVGVCMTANKIHGIRATLAWNEESARLSRQHNDANVLCLGERLIPEAEARAIADAFFAASFEGGRHADRVLKMATVEADEARRASAGPGADGASPRPATTVGGNRP